MQISTAQQVCNAHPGIICQQELQFCHPPVLFWELYPYCQFACQVLQMSTVRGQQQQQLSHHCVSTLSATETGICQDLNSICLLQFAAKAGRHSRLSLAQGYVSSVRGNMKLTQAAG